MLRQRTEAEMKAYVEGYGACFLMFVEYLKDSQDRNDIVKVTQKMHVIVQAVENALCEEVSNVRQN